MVSTSPGFDRLLAPHGVEAFFHDYWEREYLHVRRADPEYYAYALTARAVERFIDSEDQAAHLVRAVSEGRPLPASPSKLRSLYAAGATLILNHAGAGIPSLTELCSSLEQEIGCHVQANLYLTPPASAGFPAHYDTHGVFVLQIDGHKEWCLYDTPFDLLMRGEPVSASGYATRTPRVTLTLAPGDLLYIPRGMVHCARTRETASLHATVGPMQADRASLIAALVRRAEADPWFRQLLPHGLTNPSERAAFADEFAAAMMQLLARTDVAALSASYVDHRKEKRSGRVADLVDLNRLSADSVVRRRPLLEVRLTQTGQWITLQFNSQELSLPVFLKPALDAILGEAPFAISTLSSVPTPAGRLALARRFVKAGLLTVVSLNERGRIHAGRSDEGGAVRSQSSLGNTAAPSLAGTR